MNVFGLRLTFLEFACATVLWIAAVTIFATSIFAIVAYTHAMPFSDQWDLFVLPASFAKNTLASSLEALWAPHNEHRLVLFRLVNGLDFAFFGYRNYLNISVLIMAMSASVFLLIALLHQMGMGLRGAMLGPIPVIVALTFSGVQSQNLTWALGIQWHLTNAFFLGALYATAMLGRSTQEQDAATPRLHLLLGIGAATGASLSAAHGLLVWPLMVFYALWSKLPRYVAAVYAVAMALMFALYLVSIPLVPDRPSPLFALMNEPLDVLSYLLRFLGLPWYYAAYPVEWQCVAMLFGGISVVGACAALFKGQRDSGAAGSISRVTAIILLFVIGTAGMAALGRVAEFGPGQALAPRYGSVSVLLWTALLTWFLATRARGRLQQFDGGSIVGRLAVVIAMVAITTYQPRMLIQVKEWYEERELAALALLVNVRDELLLLRIFPDDRRVLAMAADLRSQRKSIFGEPRATYIGKNIADFSRSDDACVGAGERLDSVTQINSAELINHRAYGWAWDRVSARPPATLVIASEENGQVVGLASSGFARPDIRQIHRGIDSDGTGWVGLSLPVTGNLNVYAVTGPSSSPVLCLLRG